MPMAAPITYRVEVAGGHRSDLDVEHPLLAEAQHGIGQRIGLASAPARAACTASTRLDRRAVDGDKHIARPNACRHRTAASCNISGGYPFRSRFPQHAILELVRRRANSDIQRAKAQQDANQGEETPASQRTPLRSMDLVLHWFTAMWGTPVRLQTLYP